MDACVGLLRWLRAAGLAAVCGCAAADTDRTSFQQGPLPEWLTPAPGGGTVSRGQSPDGPKAPTGPLSVAPPAETPVQQAGFGPAAGALTDAFRERQLRTAAYIGTDAVITDDEVWTMVRQRSREYADKTGSELDTAQKQMYREELRRLIERELLILEMTTRIRIGAKGGADQQLEKMHQAAKADADRIVELVRKANKIPTEEDFVKVLQAQGLTYKAFRRQHERESLKNMYLRELLKDKEKFVTLNDIWDYYTGHPKEFQADERVKWLDLFVAFNRFGTPDEARRYADAVWQQANGGADFVGLVKQYGQGDSNLRDGEGIGSKKGEIQPVELEPVVLELPAGRVSPLLQTATGFHIVKVLESEKAGTRPFDGKVQADIRSKLTNQLQEREYKKVVDDLWRKHRPRVVEP